jgi:FkbM family methyltransferase
MKTKFHSQRSQAEYLYKMFFKRTRNGIFVDIGAHDGVTFSNSFFFEKELDWSGVCIEPIPEVFEKLKRNRKCECLQACVNERSGKVRFTRITGCGEMLSGISNKLDPRHVDRIRETISSEGGGYC